MIIDNVLEVVYAPRKAFKRIAANPKYVGAILIIVLFIGLQLAFEDTQFSNVYTEQTQPALSYLYDYTNASSGYWSTTSNVNVTNNSNDYFNYTIYTAAGFYPELFGNSSLQISATNTNDVQAALSNTFSRNMTDQSVYPANTIYRSSVDCSEVGFQNLSMTIKMVDPQSAPQNASLTLYTTESDFYQYDLTPTTSSLAAGQWNNLTIPVGKTASGWTASGVPSWSNINIVKLDFSYPEGSNVTIRIGSMFFRGQFQTPLQQDSTTFLLTFLNRYSLDILFSWFLITGLMYLLLKAVKTKAVWKPLFISVGCALIIMVIRSLVNLAATLTLSPIYYPFDSLPGVGLTPWGTAFYPTTADVTLFAGSQATLANIGASTALFNYITLGMFVLSYVWLAVLGVMMLGAMHPELSAAKRAIISAASIVVTVLVVIALSSPF